MHDINARHEKGRPKSPFFMVKQNLVLFFHLRAQQVTNSGRTSAFSDFRLATQALDRFFLVFNVFRLDGQADYAALAVNADDLGFDLFAFFQNVTRVFNAVTADFGGFEGRFDVVGQGDDGAFGVNFFNDTANDSALVIDSDVLGERIAFQLLDTQRDALALRINRQDHGVELVALLEATYGFFAHFVPGDVGQVNQAVDAAVQTNEDTEIGDRLDGAGDFIALVELAREIFPRVGFALFDAEGDTTTLFVDVQNHNFHFVANLNDFRRVDVLVGPVHFGNVYQAFHAFFQLCEAAVVGQVGNTRGNAGAFRVASLDSNPWVFTQLLQTQGNTIALAIVLQNLHIDLVANVDDFRWMLDTLPGHVGDVQQAIDATQIDECAVIGEVLDDTFDLLTFLQGLEQSFALGTVLGFQDTATGNDNVVALLVQLDDLELELFAFQVSRVTHRADVNQRTRQERTDAVNVDSEAAFNLTVDNALDHFFSCESRFQNDPALGTLGFFAGQLGFAKAIFDRVQRNVNFITDLDGQLASVVVELLQRDEAFRFQTGVNRNPTCLVVDINDDSGDDRTGLKVEGL
ncbi:hypothetical protein ALO95_05579 [Pseudomonas syringae pv. antirrhini]|nr:Uncharacterized protein ALO87_05623 [Pseudomonas syringae pv. apii]RMW22494.1 hypothetical protein ALO95_05579 [Pseudomonas syringae pv. antirrhini]